jgi:hypothetical protein
MRKIPLTIALVLLAVGLTIFLCDAYVIFRYGFDINDVVGITGDGGPIDWPTGERPALTFIPAFVYSFGFWLAAAVVFSLWPEVGRHSHVRSYRGTE